MKNIKNHIQVYLGCLFVLLSINIYSQGEEGSFLPVSSSTFTCNTQISVVQGSTISVNTSEQEYVYTISSFCPSVSGPVMIRDLDNCSSGLFDQKKRLNEITPTEGVTGSSVIRSSSTTVTSQRQVGNHEYANYYTTTVTITIPQNTNMPSRHYEILSYIHNSEATGSREQLSWHSFYIEQAGTPGYQFYYNDSDDDGFGDCTAVKESSNIPVIGKVTNNLDECPEMTGGFNGCPNSAEDDRRNWIQSNGFNIKGQLIASSKSYFNELGKLQQHQTYDVKEKRMWASQILYDSQGRSVFHSLSAPMTDKEYVLKYKFNEDFIINSSGDNYTTADFEGNLLSPKKVKAESNTLGAYYSTVNTDEPYQDITSYPFSRTIYSELNPGAALKTIGGNKVDTNNDGTPDSWKQSYTFSMPAGQELSREVAFGEAKYNDYKIIKTVNRDVHRREAVMFTDTDGKTLAAARVGSSVIRDTKVTISEQGFVDVHVPVAPVGVQTGFTINGVSGITTEVYDLITEAKTTAATNTLDPGFYRVSITNLDSYDPVNNPVTVTCQENYYDYSLNEYDEAGRLIASYQPVGNRKAAKPKSTFEYNALGQLTQTHSPDEGTANFKYRKDGQIRFSQNSLQATNNEFSYTNYDDLGRPIESGVVTSTSFSTIAPDNPATPSGTKKEQQFTTYDYLESTDITFLNGVNSSYANPTFLSGNVAKTSNDNNITYYSYDVYGRVKWVVQKINGLTDPKTIDYEYDPITGAVTVVDYQKHSTINDRFIHRYTYDAIDNSLIKVETSADGGSTYTNQAEYTYYETGALKQIDLARLNNTGTPLQTIDYVYNLNGQLKAINPGNDDNDLFSMQIDYHNNDYARSVSGISTPSYGQDQFNGNIKGVRWNNKTFDGSNIEQNYKTYSYYYNKNNWLTDAIFNKNPDSGGDGSKINIMDDAVYEGASKDFNATNSVTWLSGFHAKPTTGQAVTAKIVTGSKTTFQSGDYNVFDITYDANGNIRTLNRNKKTVNGENKMDQLSYVYDATKPNQLKRVDDAAGDVSGADDIGDQNDENYKYNSIGQLIENVGEGIKYFYNASGLVTEIKKNNLTLVKFFYNDRGQRVKKESYTINGGTSSLTGKQYYVRDAAGTVMAIYEKIGTQPIVAKENTIYGASRLGVYNRENNHSVYQLTDHLGNVRAVAEWSGSNAVALVATDYYPFGMPMPLRDNGANSYRYAYQGQEKDPETGKEAFELRLWDSRIGRWLSPDPHGQFHSPYLGMGNNPINGVDPDGGCWDKDGNRCADGKIGDTYTDQYGATWIFGDNGWDTNAYDAYGVTITGSLNTLSSYSNDGVVGAYVFRAKGEVNYGALNLNGHISFLDVDAYARSNRTGDLVDGKLGAQANLIRAAISAQLGTDNNNLHGSATGSLLSASANLSPSIYTGARDKYGFLIDANAGAYVAEGQYSYGINFLGVETNFTVGASVASVHGGITGGIYYDKETDKIYISGFEHLGYGIGEKLGLSLAIPITGFLPN